MLAHSPFYVPPSFCRKNGVARSKGEKTCEKVVCLAEKVHLGTLICIVWFGNEKNSCKSSVDGR